MSTWYYRKDDAEIGPLSLQELRQLATVGEISPTTLVRPESRPEWIAARRVPGLFGPKYCHVCGQECSDRPRVKDRQGRYYCRECFERTQGQPADGRATSLATSGGSSSAQDVSDDDDGLIPFADHDEQSTAGNPSGQRGLGAPTAAASPGGVTDPSAVVWDYEQASQEEEDLAAISLKQTTDRLVGWMCVLFGSAFLALNLYNALRIDTLAASAQYAGPVAKLLVIFLPFNVALVFGGLILGGILVLAQKHEWTCAAIRIPFLFWLLLTLLDFMKLIGNNWYGYSDAYRYGTWAGFLAVRALQGAFFIVLLVYSALAETHATRWVRRLVIGLPLAAFGVGVLLPAVQYWAVRREARLVRAVVNGNPSQVSRLLGVFAPVDARDERGRSVLHVAVEQGNIEITRLLLDAGADVNSTWVPAKDFMMTAYTPLLQAVKSGRHEIAALLIEHGARVNAGKGGDGTTSRPQPLWVAIRENQPECARVLLEHGAQLTERMIAEVAESGSPEMAKVLMPHAKNPLASFPLPRAVAQGNLEAVRLHLANGADAASIETKPYAAASLLLLAIEKGHENVALLLVDKGADVNLSDESGRTPLLLAVEKRSASLVKHLLEHGARADIPGNNVGRRPLHSAVQTGRIDIVRLLLDKGASPDTPGPGGNTSLIEAIRLENMEVVNLLLNASTNVNATCRMAGYTDMEQTALDYAAQTGRKDIVERLLDLGADPNLKLGGAGTVLHSLAAKGPVPRETTSEWRSREEEYAKISLLILDRGADVNAKDTRGRTPLDLAEQDSQIAKVLKEHGGKPGQDTKTGQ